jgi:hypothetical protein
MDSFSRGEIPAAVSCTDGNKPSCFTKRTPLIRGRLLAS